MAQKDYKEYGDKAILSLISKDSFDGPVFLLSDDKKLKKEAKPMLIKNSGGTITTSALIYGLVGAADLASEFEGLAHFKDDSKKTWELAKYLDKERNNLNYQVNHKNPYRHLLMTEEEYKDNVSSKPFTKSLKQLAEDLKKARAAEGAATAAIDNGNGNTKPAGMSPLDKFKARQAKAKLAKPGIQ